MGKHVAGEQEVAALFRLLNRISDGYEPTGPEWAALNEVEGIAFSFRETRKNFSLRGVDKLARVNPKFCVNPFWGANRAKFIRGGSRLVRRPPYQQNNA